MSFDRFNLHPSLMQGIRDMGYAEPTPIQEQAIPVVMTGRDLIAVAQTGTGKTAAFLLPILHRLMTGPPHVTRCLILAPTRELATQIDDNRVGLAYHTPLSGASVFGGADILPQARALKAGADIVVATPGRLLDHLYHKLPKLEKIEVLVLDEADRMLDMGFLPDIEKILRRLPDKRQNLLFSATMPPEIERLAREFMVDPQTITIGHKSRPVDLVRQEAVAVSPQHKTSVLVDILRERAMRSVLVFARTKVGADRLFNDLRRHRFNCAVIHGDRSQEERFKSLEAFRQGQVDVLVATDVAARGIDVDGISHVINFDVPRTSDDYVHRVGRTGRAGETGHAITFVTREEERQLHAIERAIGATIPRRGALEASAGAGDGGSRSAPPRGGGSGRDSRDARDGRDSRDGRGAHDGRRDGRPERRGDGGRDEPRRDEPRRDDRRDARPEPAAGASGSTEGRSGGGDGARRRRRRGGRGRGRGPGGGGGGGHGGGAPRT